MHTKVETAYDELSSTHHPASTISWPLVGVRTGDNSGFPITTATWALLISGLSGEKVERRTHSPLSCCQNVPWSRIEGQALRDLCWPSKNVRSKGATKLSLDKILQYV